MLRITCCETVSSTSSCLEILNIIVSTFSSRPSDWDFLHDATTGTKLKGSLCKTLFCILKI